MSRLVFRACCAPDGHTAFGMSQPGKKAIESLNFSAVRSADLI